MRHPLPEHFLKALLAAIVFVSCTVGAGLPPEAAGLIRHAGNANDDHERQADLEKLAALPVLDPALRAEADALGTFVRKWNESSLKFYAGQYKGSKSYDPILCYQFDAYKGVTIPKHELLYRMVTGDKNAPRFPQLAVRWLTPPQDIAALVTEASTTHLEAELFHFGTGSRPMTAQLHLLAPGSYEVQLLAEGRTAGAAPAPFQVQRGRITEVKLDLPSRRLCVLKIVPVGH